jgi:hypothetical protein
MSVILFLLFISIIPILSFAQQNNTSVNSTSNSSMWNTTKATFGIAQNDTIPPKVNITYPFYPITVTTGKIAIDANVSDSESGIHNVSARAHTFPFKGDFPIHIGTDTALGMHNNWAFRSVPLKINHTGAYRVIIEASDNAGNRNYAETTVNAVFPRGTISNTTGASTYPNIAFVRPTFTEAAYQRHGFIDFYYDYGFPPLGQNITTDLDMLTVKTPKSVPEFRANDIKHLSNITSLIPVNGTELHDVSYNYFPIPQKFWLPFIDNVKKVAPNTSVTVIRDEDVHDGHIFYIGNNKTNTPQGSNANTTTNAFDILVLFHNEYVTQNEYDNLRQFVKNGGTILFMDANVFRAEVNYDKDNHTVTLVKGHDWQFDGKAARRSVPERWYYETKEWMGSNFLDIDANAIFANNPFNYIHSEEQFVNNPNATIIYDYDIRFPENFIQLYANKEKLPNELTREDIPMDKIKVATYSLQYGNGKVIVLGLSGQNMAENQQFMRFFDNQILPIVLCPKFQPCK